MNLTEPVAEQSTPTGDASTSTHAVSILIVAYNSTDVIADCLDSIPASCRDHNVEILMVDNGDGATEALVAGKYSNVRIIESKGNIGFAAGNNWLAQHAVSEQLLLLNPDMVLLPGAIDALLKGSLDHPEASAWGGVTLDENGEPDSGNAIAMPSLLEFASSALGKSLVGTRPIEGLETDAPVEVLVGGFVMFRKSVWDTFGGLDERYFLYCEEVDLFHRLAAQGHTFWRIAAARGHHAVGHGHSTSAMRLAFRAAGTMEFARRHWSWHARMLTSWLLWIAAVERVIGGKLLGGSRPRLRQMQEAYRLVATRPGLWKHGYHPARGLKAQLDRDPTCAQ